MKKSQEDDDLESLRLKLIRAEKENEELRNRIIEQHVKQSNVINQDGPEDMKAVQPSDAMFQDLRNRILELVKQTNLINRDGSDHMKAVQISNAVFQRVRNRVIEQLKQSNVMTQRQLSDAIIQELGQMRRIISQNDYRKGEFRSTADSAFDILPQVPGDQTVRSETSAANSPPAALQPTGETNELAPGGHPADNSGINREPIVSPHREPISSPPIQFHGDPSFLSEAALPPIQFRGHPPPFPSGALLPMQFHGNPPQFLNAAALHPIQFHHGNPPQFLNAAALYPIQIRHGNPPQFLNAAALPPIQFHHHNHPPQFPNAAALPRIQFHAHPPPPPFPNEALPDFGWAGIAVDGPEDMKIVQITDAMFQDMRNRVLELVKGSNFINKDGPDDMKAVQTTDAIFQQVRTSLIQRVKQSNDMTRRQLSDAFIQEVRDKARKFKQDDSLKEELRSTADSAFNSTTEIMPQGGTEVTGDHAVGCSNSAHQGNK